MHEPAVSVTNNPDERRYEVRLGTQVVGYTRYELGEHRITFVHTEVDPSVEGRGIGSRLAREAIADARARNLAVAATCPFISAYLRRHPLERR
ncbi:MAG TPA: GNAT family N-acetyltransferase [Candidatus Limnocylindrales bacterium]|nr:GNAT family N-acetyltransferase [Candidatus Limnocylindrales bacterium]